MGNGKILPVGTLFRLTEFNPDRLAFLHEVGMNCCQLCGLTDNYLSGETGEKNTKILAEALKKYEIEPLSVFFSFPDQNWTPDRSINTVGLTPKASRPWRFAMAARQMNWARQFGIQFMTCHVGYLPRHDSPDYAAFLEDLRQLCKFAAENGQQFLFETGQESDTEMIQCLNDLAAPNAGINFDPANLLLYNNTEPLDFLDSLGKYVRVVHCKDGRRPADGEKLGKETPLGKGDTKFGQLLEKLYGAGFRGPLIIEREILPGAEQDADIRSAVTYLHSLRNRLTGNR